MDTSLELLQNKVEHLERERIELTMQLHKRDEKDRDRKLRVEHLERRLKQSEDERSKAVNELHEGKDTLSKLMFENHNLQEEVNRLTKELQSSNRFEAMDVWKKMTTATRELKRVEEELITVSEEKTLLSKELSLLKSELVQFRESQEKLQQELDLSLETRSILEEKVSALTEENSTVLRELSALQLEILQHKTTEATVAQLQKELDLSLETRSILEEKVSALTEENSTVLQEISALQLEILQHKNIAEETLQAAATEINSTSTLEYDQIINDLKQKLIESEKMRRKLHNQVQDLRGNIRVFIRCRPFLPSDGEDSYQTKQSSIIFNEDGNSISLINTQNSVSSNNGSGRMMQVTHQFAFDKTFGQETQQHEIYNEVSGLVQSVLDGYRVCVFSYGQTGSGKTHTMTGDRVGNQRGIIPRSIEELLQQSQKLQEDGWEIQLTMSIVELYNEELRDLLCSSNHRTGANTSTTGEKFKIMRQTNGRVIVNGLSNVPITTIDYDQGLEQFYVLLERASQMRSTACTNMNETSSRSHLIVMIDVVASYVSQNGLGQKVILNGGLRLCDLAGSERLDRTNTLNDSARLKETVNINKSLSCLADVFLALSNKQSHVPYRNSKLTMLLQDCLSGDGKSLMFVNVSPTVASSPETLCSLRFASQVSQVELGKAQKHITTTSMLPPPPPLPPAAVNNVLTSPSAKSKPTTRETPIVRDNSSRKRPFAAVEGSTPCSTTDSASKENLKSFLANEISPKPFTRSAAAMINKPAPVYSFLANNPPVANGSFFVASTATKSRLGNPVRKQQPAATSSSTQQQQQQQQQLNTFVRKKTKYFR